MGGGNKFQLAAWVLLEEHLTRQGIKKPQLSDTRENYASQMANSKASQVAKLCSIAYALSLKDELAEYEFIAEMHAMGHVRAMDVFVQNV